MGNIHSYDFGEHKAGKSMKGTKHVRGEVLHKPMESEDKSKQLLQLGRG